MSAEVPGGITEETIWWPCLCYDHGGRSEFVIAPMKFYVFELPDIMTIVYHLNWDAKHVKVASCVRACLTNKRKDEWSTHVMTIDNGCTKLNITTDGNIKSILISS